MKKKEQINIIVPKEGAQALLKEVRLMAGISQGELAEIAGLKQPHLNRIEKCTQGTSVEILERIYMALGFRLVLMEMKEKEINKSKDNKDEKSN